MASFTDQIQYYTGDTDLEYSGSTQQWFEDGIRDVIGRVEKIMPDKLSMFTSNQTVTSSGLELVNNRVFSVERGGKEASEVNAKLRYNLTDIESIYYAYPDSPSYYRLANKLYVLPSPGTGTISAFILSAQRELVDGVYITRFTCPSNHQLNNLDFIDITADSTALPAIYTENTLQVTFINSTEFTVDIPWSNIYGERLFSGASGSEMDDPSDVWYPGSNPSIKISSATAEVVTIGTVSNGDASTDGSITSFPTSMYHLPVLYTSINILYRKMRDMTITAFTEPTAFVAPASLSSIDIDYGTLPDFPTFVPNLVSLDFSDANTWLNTEEDTEMVSSRMNIISGQIQEYQANIQNEVSRVQNEAQNYQQKVAKALQEYQAETGYDVAKQSSDLQSAVQVYTSSLQTENAIFQANMAKDTTEYQWLMGQLQYLKQLYNEGFIQAPQS
tara:strand:- start:4959 stop:6293 length:1335 start_codon:yes stop_codon:yes gene_type:complete